MTYDLEAELCGTEHLNKAPVTQRTVEFYKPASSGTTGIRPADSKIAGFFAPASGDGLDSNPAESGTEPAVPGRESGPINNFSTFEYWRDPLPVIDLDLEVIADAEEPGSSLPTGTGERFGTADLPALEAYLQTRSYLVSYQLTAVDRLVAAQLADSVVDPAEFCNVSRWLRHVASHPRDETVGPEAVISLAAVRAHILAGENFRLEEVTVVDNVVAADDDRRGGQCSSDEGVSLCDSDKENAELCDEDSEGGEDSNDGEDDDGDDDGWITPGNLKEKKAAMAGRAENERVVVACMTTDFAMQNVLKQIGLNIIGTNGLIIRVSLFFLR